MTIKRVMYVDAFSTPWALANTRGMSAAYRRAVPHLLTFDYRLGVPPKAGARRRAAVAEMNERLVAAALEFRPDLVHLGKCEIVSGESVRRIKAALPGCVVCHFYGDFRRDVQPYVASIGREADWTLLHHKDEAVWEKHRAAGCKRVGYWRVGVDANVFKPDGNARKEYDLVMMSNTFGSRNLRPGQPNRTAFVLHMAERGFDVHLFGMKTGKIAGIHPNLHAHGFVDMGEFASACSRARIALNYCIYQAPLYVSWRRLFGTMASGCMMLTRYVPGLEEVFADGEHLAWFDGFDECADLARRYLDDDDARERIAAAGRAEVEANHTWDDSIASMLGLAEGARS